MKLLTINSQLNALPKFCFYILMSVFLICSSLQPTSGSEDTAEESDDKVLEHLALFSEILGHIKDYHLETPDNQEIITGAINGMLRKLDPYSQFIPDYLAFQTENQGKYAGLGMTIGIREDMLTVITPFKNNPAALAGVLSGDIISHIEDESTATMSLSDAVDRLRGEPGTSVSITIIRKNESRPIELTITRNVIRIPSVEQNIIGDNIGYIKINQFLNTTADDVDNAFDTFKAENVRGIILDLRFNPGGLLSSAVDIASDFLTPGQLVVYSQGKGPGSRENFPAEGAKRENFSLIVLVNGGSASASEIVAGAVKDHKRGLVMGEKTFGKASVQRVFRLSNGKSAVKLTVASYYTPSGGDIEKIGIIPDVEIEWFSRSEQQMHLKLRNHEKLKTFIDENGDDVLNKLFDAEHAASDDEQAARLRRNYQRLSDALTEEQIVLSDRGLKYALAQITETPQDELEHDPQIVAAMDQLKVLELFGNQN